MYGEHCSLALPLERNDDGFQFVRLDPILAVLSFGRRATMVNRLELAFTSDGGRISVLRIGD